ncbi:cuticle protein 19.8-like [Penaeus chinensis]|uniref:cuticle protein 19.8-like n=1 Tax=Penaeus chinensis TaxID=139456 RepID=UPI001FB73EBA|nr:cuticle protein 19.8-like [Penaeus chinensis]
MKIKSVRPRIIFKCPFTAVVLALAAVAASGPSQPAYSYTPEPKYECSVPFVSVYAIKSEVNKDSTKYDFNYAVKDEYSGNNFGHQENRDGYNTQGSYYALLPDGRLQKVIYTVNGDSGYVVEVSYEGEAQYPVYKPAPAYKPTPAYA